MKTLTLLAVLFLSACSFGSTTCQSTFTLNPGKPTALNFCVTENGNIAMLNTGIPQIQDGAEGYALCGINDTWDLGLYGDSGNWLPSVITQPGGPDTFPLTISRSTVGGTASIVQSFSVGKGGQSVHVKMTVTGAGRLYRFAHVIQQNGDHNMRSSFIWSSGGYGLTAAPALTPRVTAGLMTGGKPANICNPTGTPNLPYIGDSALLLAWMVTTNRKNTVSFDYVPMR